MKTSFVLRLYLHFHENYTLAQSSGSWECIHSLTCDLCVACEPTLLASISASHSYRSSGQNQPDFNIQIIPEVKYKAFANDSGARNVYLALVAYGALGGEGGTSMTFYVLTWS